jgi:signal peptidase II
MGTRLARWAPLLAGGILVLLLDQWSKAQVIATLPLGGSWEPIPAVASIFKITHSQNSGAAFSIFTGANLPLLLLSITMAIGIVIFYPRSTNTGQRLALGLLLGGVLGNSLDRIHYGIVIDYIHWQIPGVISNVSNLADHAIVVSVIILFLAQSKPVRYASSYETSPANPEPTPASDKVD